MIAALLRFGSFRDWKWQHGCLSASDDYAPDTPTFTLLNAKYTTKYFVFKSLRGAEPRAQSINNPPFPSNLHRS